MDNLIPCKIVFGALRADPLRTKERKDKDFVSVDNQMRKYTLLNEELARQISFLEQEILSLATYCQHSDTKQKVDIEKKIETKKQLIKDLKKQIESNRASSSALWYGYHERL